MRWEKVRLAGLAHHLPERRVTSEELEGRLAPLYERLGLRARLESGMIVATTIVDLFGNRTIVAFEDVRFDRKPGPATFRFDPSPGVEVIDLDRPSPDS